MAPVRSAVVARVELPAGAPRAEEEQRAALVLPAELAARGLLVAREPPAVAVLPAGQRAVSNWPPRSDR